MIRSKNEQTPIVYSCSGCSSAAQMANAIAIRLDREGLAEMSCIAGVGGGVPSLVRIAQSGRPIFALDGCPLQCVIACLSLRSVSFTRHFTLSDYGVKRRKGRDFDEKELEEVYQEIRERLLGYQERLLSSVASEF